MGEFTAITTQEQFDQAIGERLKREREVLEKKYSNYDELKSKNEGYQKQLDDYAKALDEATKKAEGNDTLVAELQGRIKSYESDSVKTRIAHEMGIPYEFAGRLAGEDEDAIRKDAEEISKLLKNQTHPAPPLKSTETGGDGKQEAFKTMLSDLKGE